MCWGLGVVVGEAFPPSGSFPEAFVFRQFDISAIAELLVPEGA